MNSIKIQLKPHLADYLRHVMKSYGKKEIIVSQNGSIGTIICTLAKECNVPEFRPLNENDVTLLLPSLRGRNIERSFIYFNKASEQVIQAHIRAEFNMVFYRHMSFAISCGMEQQKAIYLFMRGYKFREEALTFDALKKKFYRFAQAKDDFLLGVMQESEI